MSELTVQQGVYTFLILGLLTRAWMNAMHLAMCQWSLALLQLPIAIKNSDNLTLSCLVGRDTHIILVKLPKIPVLNSCDCCSLFPRNQPDYSISPKCSPQHSDHCHYRSYMQALVTLVASARSLNKPSFFPRSHRQLQTRDGVIKGACSFSVGPKILFNVEGPIIPKEIPK